MNISKYFEILSHPIRFSILQYIDIDIRSFSDILENINSEGEIVSSTPQLSFHLRKMIEEGIVNKFDSDYSLSETGLKLLSLINQFEHTDFQHDSVSTVEHDSSPIKPEKIDLKNIDLPLIKRPENLNQLVSTFEYFEGKNYNFMEDNYFLKLPECISTNTTPKTWIESFSKQILPLLKMEQSKEWIIDRYLKLGYGTRGLHDYGLMDASLSVPPLQSTFDTLIELLVTRGKAALYSGTGMGKSRLSLFLASYWVRNFETTVLYVQDPHLLRDKDYDNLQAILNKYASFDRESPKWLVIIEDGHLIDEDQISNLKKLISGASNHSYSILITFTRIEKLKNTYKVENPHWIRIEELLAELIPTELMVYLNLHSQWDILKPYFYEWIKWVALDILFDYIPDPELIKLGKETHNSPWSFVVSLGFLKNALILLRDTSTNNKFPLVLYYSLAQLYIMRNEKGIHFDHLVVLLQKFFNKELDEIYGENWVEQLILILNSWSSPSKRLIPPFQYPKKPTSITGDIIIPFYHLQWAEEVCNFLDSGQNKPLFERVYSAVFNTLYKVWNELNQYDQDTYSSFVKWLRENIKFKINMNGDVLITSFDIESKEKDLLTKFQMPDTYLKELDQSELVNWYFIKSIIVN